MKETLERRADWSARLVAYLAQVARVAYHPGALDCALFAAGADKAMTGRDLAAEYRGKYASIEDGKALLAAAGFADHVEFVAAHFEEVIPACAQVGDLAVVPGDGGLALGIVQGANVYTVNRGGLTAVSRLQMLRAFKI